MPTEALQPCMLAMFKAYDAYCERYHLDYFADSGTLLGAIRHQGFIPWDDDMDVTMPQPSYERLLDLARVNPYLDPEHHYKVLLPNEGTNNLPFIKVVDTRTVTHEYIFREYERFAKGVWIDVFCLSFVPDDPAQAKRYYRAMHRYNRLGQLLTWGPNIRPPYKHVYPLISAFRRVCDAVGLTNEHWMDKLRQLQKSAPSAGNLRANLVYPSGFHDRFKAEDFDSYLRVPFEDTTIRVPVGYEDVLATQYGDWRQLPPKDQQVGHHGYDAYYVDPADGSAPTPQP